MFSYFEIREISIGQRSKCRRQIKNEKVGKQLITSPTKIPSKYKMPLHPPPPAHRRPAEPSQVMPELSARSLLPQSCQTKFPRKGDGEEGGGGAREREGAGGCVGIARARVRCRGVGGSRESGYLRLFLMSLDMSGEIGGCRAVGRRAALDVGGLARLANRARGRTSPAARGGARRRARRRSAAPG